MRAWSIGDVVGSLFGSRAAARFQESPSPMPTPVAVTPMPKKVFPKFSSASPPPVDVVVSAPVPPAQPTPPTRRREPIKRQEASKEAAQPKKITRPKAPWNF